MGHRYGPNRQPDVIITIEYDCRGTRKQKKFRFHRDARPFFAQKLNAGRNPKLTVQKV